MRRDRRALDQDDKDCGPRGRRRLLPRRSGPIVRRFRLRAAGLLLRLLDASDDTAAPALRDELEGLLTVWCADLATSLRVRPVPVRAQVAHQTRTTLAAAESALRATGLG
ncbi:hypothetical protein ABZT43_41165 [Streptomyces sp. NPDC005349]|uniref:hypothetical protein n=1 Tax=Streptomyces sp. NPDC005349 TaxID=3157037 RepID=UPI0033A002F7